MDSPILDWDFQPGDRAILNWIDSDQNHRTCVCIVMDSVEYYNAKMYIINIPDRIVDSTDNTLPQELYLRHYERPGHTLGLADPDELDFPIRQFEVVGGTHAGNETPRWQDN
jgi:hypothetical protein